VFKKALSPSRKAGACAPKRKVNDPPGTISRANQQRAGAAYLAALARYYIQNGQTARPYPSGEKQVEGLEGIGVAVQSQGLVRSTYLGL
jgi:hypothetical protein